MRLGLDSIDNCDKGRNLIKNEKLHIKIQVRNTYFT